MIPTMFLPKNFVVFMLMVLFVIASDCDAWRRRRRRRFVCTPRSCEVSYWSTWSTCSTDQCGQQGSQGRSRIVQSLPSCAGAQCPDLNETRLCYGNKPVNCHLSHWSSWSACSTDQCGKQGSHRRSRTVESSPNCGGARCPDLNETWLCYGNKPVNCNLSHWSEWSACTTVCGVSGKQTIYRHRIRTEQCGGVCTSTFYKTRACPLTSCLNGGSLRGETCFCKKGFGGNCCEKEGNIYRLATVKCLLASL